MKNSRNIQVGTKGEVIAKEYLEKIGYKILETNWHYSKNSEIDIIAIDKKTLVFVEVKTRTSENFGHPLEAITPRKLEKIHMATLAYIQAAKVKYENYRIDAISVIGLNQPKIEHLKNISLN